MRLLALMFDVDGTLVDSFGLAFEATANVLTKRGFAAVSEAEYLEGCRYCTPERLARHAGLAPGTADFERLGRELGADFDADYISKVSTETAPLFDGLKDVIARARHNELKLGCLTNAALDYAKVVLRTHDLEFDSVHGADSVPKPKPAPDGLLTCCEELNVAPRNCVYVGDSPSDGAAAVAARFAAAIGVAWPGAANSFERLVECGHFDYVVRAVPELEAILFDDADFTKKWRASS